MKIIIALLTLIMLAGCIPENSRESGIKDQEGVMTRAVSKIPTYQPSHFLTRQAVNKWMERMDQPAKTFYIYLLGNNGSHIGYYVGQTRPICSSTLMTPPDRLSRGSGKVVTSAPSLDGVYSGGDCGSFFFFDATTDAYIEIQGLNFFVADQPLNVDADPINVQSN